MGRHWGDAGRFKMMCKMYEVLKIMKVDPIQLGLKDNPGKQGVVEMVLTLGMKKDADWTEIECEIRRRASTAPRVESETKTHPGFLLSQIKDLTGIESGTTIKKYRELAGVQHGTGKRDYRWSKTETLKTLRAIVSHSNVDADIKRAKASILVVENER